MLDYLTSKAREGVFAQGDGHEDEKTILEKEYREALNVLEDDGHVQLIGHSSCPVIRFVKQYP